MDQSKMGYPPANQPPPYAVNQQPPVVVYVTSGQPQPQQYSYPPHHHQYPPQQQQQQQQYPPTTAPIQKGNSSWRNKPQSQAIAAGGFIMFSAGMNLALGVGWSMYSMVGDMKHFCFSWFIGVIIGTLLSLPLQRVITTRIIMAITSGLIIIGGIIFIAQPDDADAILAGRYINGIAVGLTIVPYLVHASEIADDSYRGTCLATEQYSVSCGIALQMIYSSYWSYNTGFRANILHGIFDIVFGIMALVCLKVYMDSPTYLIRHGDEGGALDNLVRLQQPKMYTLQKQEQFDRLKTYIREEENLSLADNVVFSTGPLIKMLLYRSMMLAFCCSLPMQLAFQYSMLYEYAGWAPSVAACVRILGSLFSLVVMDKMGRKLPSLFTMVILGSLILGLGYMLHSFFITSNIADAKHLYIAIQFFVGFYSPFTSVYLGEAFTMKVKPFYMAVCIIMEQFLHIIFITTIALYLGDNLSAQGGIIVGAFVILCLTMPETHNTTLSEAQRRFRKFFYFKFK